MLSGPLAGAFIKGEQLVDKGGLAQLIFRLVAHYNADDLCSGALEFIHDGSGGLGFVIARLDEKHNSIHLRS